MVNTSRAWQSRVGVRQPAECRLSHLKPFLHQRSRSGDRTKTGDPEEWHSDFDGAPFAFVFGSTSEVANLDAPRLPIPHRMPHQGLVWTKNLVAAPTCAAPEVHRTVHGGEDPGRAASITRIACTKKQKEPRRTAMPKSPSYTRPLVWPNKR